MSMACQQCGLLHPAGTPCFTLSLPTQGAADALQPGTVLAGRYAILRTIHRGGMSVVYLAEDRVQGRQVALKELRLPHENGTDPPGYAEAEAWFARESYLLSTLSHPLIPEFYSVFREGGHSYIAQEYVSGENLQELIARQGPIEERQVVAWGRALCGLLSYLHGDHPGGGVPVVFRDLKPANILVRRCGVELTVVDFGIAKPYQPDPHGAPRPGTVLGTPGYAAPEQYQGFATPQSDIYALGATMHRLLTGYDPEQGTPFVFPPVRSLNPAVSAPLAAAVEWAVRLNPAERFVTASAFDAALASGTERGYPPRRLVRPTADWAQHAWLVASLILVLPLVGMGIFRSNPVMHNVSYTVNEASGFVYMDDTSRRIQFNDSCHMKPVTHLDGSTYIVAGPNQRLSFIEPGGDLIGSITTSGAISDCALSEAGGSPTSLAWGTDGNLWITQPDGDAIVKMMPDGALHHYLLALRTHPESITQGSDGAMWFIANGTGTIGRIDTDGAVRYFPLPGIAGAPDGLVPGPDGRLWFPEYQSNRIGQISMQGRVTEVTGSQTLGDGAIGMIGDPRSHAFWFTGGSQVFRVAEGGNTTAFQAPNGDQQFADITTGTDGNLWWADAGQGYVGKISPDGIFTPFALPDSDVQPSSIIAGPDGNMWFTENHGGAIGRVTPNGKITEFGAN